METQKPTWTRKHTEIVEEMERYLEQEQYQIRKVYPSYSEYIKALHGKIAHVNTQVPIGFVTRGYPHGRDEE